MKQERKDRVFDIIVNAVIIAGVIGVAVMFAFIQYLGGLEAL